MYSPIILFIILTNMNIIQFNGKSIYYNNYNQDINIK